LDTIQEQLRLLDERLSQKSLSARILTTSPLLIPACGLIAGIILQQYTELSMTWPFVILLVCVITCASSFAIRRTPRQLNIITITCCIGFAGLGAIRLINFYQPKANDIRNYVSDQRTMATIRGFVITEPKYEDRESWKFGRYQWSEPASSFYLKLDKAKTTTDWADVTGTVRVQVSGVVTNIQPGDYVQLYCWLSRFERPLNPGQFDIKKYLARRGIYIAASVKTPEAIKKLYSAAPAVFARLKNKLKNIAAEALLDESIGDEEAGSLLAALLLGQRTNLDAKTYQAFRETGLAHFISLSGLHFGILAGSLWWLCKIAGLSKRARAVTCFILTLLYILIVPPRAPTLRAAVICWFFCLSVIVRRKPSPINTLSLAAIVLLLIRPTDLFSAGWQLSYSAVLGILLMCKHVHLWFCQSTINKISIFKSSQNDKIFLGFTRSFLSGLLAFFAVGICAWLGGAGIMLYHFGTIAPMASVWTVLVFPLVFAILILGFFKIALSALLPTIAMTLGLIAGKLAGVFITIVEHIASWNISGVLIGKVCVSLIILYYFFILLIRFGHFRKLLVRRIIYVTIALLILMSLGATKYKRSYRDALELTCLSVGHGQAIFTALEGSANILFDAGSISTKDPGRRIILPFLRQKGISKLNAIFLSHDDIDHINGVPEIVGQCSVNGIYVNTAFMQKANTPSMAGFLSSCLKNENQSLQPLRGNTEFDSKARITPLWPDEQIGRDSSISDNDKSEVFLIEFSGRKILLCSDIELFAQEQILQLYPDLKVDVMVLPHHGSTRNLSDEFIRNMAPEILVASCRRTRYESAYKGQSNTKVFYTPIDGAITIKIKADGTIHTAGFRMQHNPSSHAAGNSTSAGNTNTD
jgi:competence protein ComEC